MGPTAKFFCFLQQALWSCHFQNFFCIFEKAFLSLRSLFLTPPEGSIKCLIPGGNNTIIASAYAAQITINSPDRSKIRFVVDSGATHIFVNTLVGVENYDKTTVKQVKIAVANSWSQRVQGCLMGKFRWFICHPSQVISALSQPWQTLDFLSISESRIAPCQISSPERSSPLSIGLATPISSIFTFPIRCHAMGR